MEDIVRAWLIESFPCTFAHHLPGAAVGAEGATNHPSKLDHENNMTTTEREVRDSVIW
jgi:hypothetical protein